MEEMIELIETFSHQRGWFFHLLSYIMSCMLIGIFGMQIYRIAIGKASIGSLFNINDDHLQSQIDSLQKDKEWLEKELTASREEKERMLSDIEQRETK